MDELRRRAALLGGGAPLIGRVCFLLDVSEAAALQLERRQLERRQLEGRRREPSQERECKPAAAAQEDTQVPGAPAAGSCNQQCAGGGGGYEWAVPEAAWVGALAVGWCERQQLLTVRGAGRWRAGVG
jgi:hypothetical protein